MQYNKPSSSSNSVHKVMGRHTHSHTDQDESIVSVDWKSIPPRHDPQNSTPTASAHWYFERALRNTAYIISFRRVYICEFTTSPTTRGEKFYGIIVSRKPFLTVTICAVPSFYG